MRMHDCTPAVVPRGEPDTAAAAIVVYIFEPAHHEGDASEAETGADDGSPSPGVCQ